jgi:hypothetical protein
MIGTYCLHSNSDIFDQLVGLCFDAVWVHEVHQLNSDIKRLVAFPGTVRATCSDYHPEDWVGASNLAMNQIKWHVEAKTIIHIDDVPVLGQAYCDSVNHEEESRELRPLIQTVAKRGIHMSCLKA